MKHSFKVAAAALCLALGVASSQAQVTNTATIKLQTLNIALTGLVGGTNGGTANTFRLTTKDVIHATGITSNTAAKLQFASTEIVTTNSTNQAMVFFITSGTTKSPVLADVSSLFQVETNSDFLVRGNTGNQILSFAFGVDTNGMVLTNLLGGPLTPVTFRVQGFTTFQKSGAFNSVVNGAGTSGDSSTVLKGNIKASPPSNTEQTVVIIR